MDLITRILEGILGLFFMVGAFTATGIRGAFSRGPWLPIRMVHRVIFFLAGLVVFADSIHRISIHIPIHIR